METESLPVMGYAVVRCADGMVVAEMSSFPNADRSIMYRTGREVSFVPLAIDEIVGTPALLTKLLERRGYRVEPAF
ncbi:hypothetical protein TUM12370_24650 [Salmonella enterica subsp. enterica serovar Choleraesuis]|nr:hypothetical protein TUM12370_24650 [Salmonella enterica subsp. enterica serovar Choleraesuis]